MFIDSEKAEKQKLQAIEQELNEQVSTLAKLSPRLDNGADRVNQLIYLPNKQFESWRAFYQGVYIDDLNHKKININELASLEKLCLVLAHEVGHALGFAAPAQSDLSYAF